MGFVMAVFWIATSEQTVALVAFWEGDVGWI
jgi:hypothetical protein